MTDKTFDTWESIRRWCISYLEIFIKYAPLLDTQEGHQQYRDALNETPITWREVKRITDPNARHIVDTITGVISESVATKSALPGDFESALKAVRAWIKVLHNNMDSKSTAQAISQIENDMLQ